MLKRYVDTSEGPQDVKSAMNWVRTKNTKLRHYFVNILMF